MAGQAVTGVAPSVSLLFMLRRGGRRPPGLQATCKNALLFFSQRKTPEFSGVLFVKLTFHLYYF
ncbi:hypothetical protein ASE07_03720 [Noviherbaspirillum sp. Root189]|nr:hypothetical protein ASE07_03720 [Noviherbaspirillum sp. Root189]